MIHVLAHWLVDIPVWFSFKLLENNTDSDHDATHAPVQV